MSLKVDVSNPARLRREHRSPRRQHRSSSLDHSETSDPAEFPEELPHIFFRKSRRQVCDVEIRAHPWRLLHLERRSFVRNIRLYQQRVPFAFQRLCVHLSLRLFGAFWALEVNEGDSFGYPRRFVLNDHASKHQAIFFELLDDLALPNRFRQVSDEETRPRRVGPRLHRDCNDRLSAIA